MMDVCQLHMHKHATYWSCTNPWWHHADATSRPTVLLIIQLMPFLVLTNRRQKTNHGELANGTNMTSTHESFVKDQLTPTPDAVNTGYVLPPDHQTPASLLAPKAPQYMFAHWAPLSDDTKATRVTFQQWVFTVPALLESSIPWAHATCTPDGHIAVAINSNRQLAILRDIGPLSQMVNPTFVRTLYLGNDLASTIAFLHNKSQAPLVIAPVLNDINIATITKELVSLGAQPVFGPITNFKKLVPGAWSFQVWSAYRHNQLLRNTTIAKWQALVTPQEPAPGSTDKTALILYNSGTTPLSTTDINFALARKTPHDSPRTAAISQFVEPTTDQLQQKWILGFITSEETTYFLKRKQWIHLATEIQEARLGLRACKGPEPPRKKNDKALQGGGNNGTTRGGKRNK